MVSFLTPCHFTDNDVIGFDYDFTGHRYIIGTSKQGADIISNHLKIGHNINYIIFGHISDIFD